MTRPPSDPGRRGWLQRLRLKDAPVDPEWVEVAEGMVDSETGSSYAALVVQRLREAGIEAREKPHIQPDRVFTLGAGPAAAARIRFAVLVRTEDQTRARALLEAEPVQLVSDEELDREAREATPDDEAS